MALPGIALRLVLAAVFVVAAIGKLRDRAGTRRAVEDFHVPAALVTPVAVLLAPAEIAVALLLVPGPTALAGAIGSLLLLLAFEAGIGASMLRGEAPDCHCFGQIYSEPVGPRTLVRNAVLAAMSVAVLAASLTTSDTDAFNTLSHLSQTGRLAAIALVATLLLLAAVLQALGTQRRRTDEILMRLDRIEARVAAGGAAPPATPTYGLQPGSAAPVFTLPNLGGRAVSLGDLLATGRPLFLLFTSPSCIPCEALMPEIADWQREHAGRIEVVAVSRGPLEDAWRKAGKHGLAHVLIQEGKEVEAAYGAPGTPCAVVIRPDGTIGSPVAAGAEGVRWLLGQILSLIETSASPAPADVAANPAAGPVPSPAQ